MNNHTPRPWYIGKALTIKGPHPKGDGRIVPIAQAIYGPGFYFSEAEANANLISAAPDYHDNAEEGIKIATLLMDFTRKIGDLETRDRCRKWIDKQYAAIAKANGEQQS